MAVMNRGGETRGRVIATVLGGLNIVVVAGLLVAGAVAEPVVKGGADEPLVIPLSPLAGAVMGQIGSPLSLVRSLVGLVLAAAIIFLIWQPASSAYYDSRSSPSPI